MLLVSCAGAVKRPNANACWIIAGAGEKDCYNTLTDYDFEGNRLAGAQPKTYATSLKKLNGQVCFDANSQEELERFRKESVKWGRDHCK